MYWKMRFTVVKGEKEGWNPVLEDKNTQYVWKFQTEDDMRSHWQNFCKSVGGDIWDYPYNEFLQDMIRDGQLVYTP